MNYIVKWWKPKSITISLRNATTVATAKNENMELYKLKLPNGIVDKIIDFSLGKEDLCKSCRNWRYCQEAIECNLDIKSLNERNVEDYILIFLTVYEIPPYDYLKAVLKISKKSMKLLTTYYGH